MKQIGILTWFWSPNYGSQLQAYALKQIVEKLGFEARFIFFTRKPLAFKSLTHMPLVVLQKLNPLFNTSEYRFVRRMLKNDFISPKGATDKSRKYNAVICGSDQLWAPNLYNPTYMLDFVPDEVKKISYAVSIGLNEIPDNLIGNYKKYVGRLNYVSVREDKGRELLSSQCGIDSVVTLDPTLMLPEDEWKKIRKESKINEPYIFCYFLNKNHKYRNAVQDYAKENGLTIYGITTNPNDREWMHMLNKQEVEAGDFIGLINGAATVITDSYHGTIFSLLQHKNFITLERFANDDIICQNSRIYQLCSYFGINGNIVALKEDTKLSVHQVDYEHFESVIVELRQKSMDFLTKALS